VTLEGKELFDGEGRTVQLGARLGEGGEGVVHELALDDSAVAKVYHQPLTPQRAAKIRAMMAMGAGPLARFTAWPRALLFLRPGVPVGLVMPRVIAHRVIHQLYSPKSRRMHFPRADWRFLVRVATNLARAVAAVHDSGCVIGDVNPSGVLVAQDAQVRLIDCDSFQICAEGTHYLCHVGVPHFMPPELQDKDLTGVVRTVDHDVFGLAILVFLLLFMGRHPFAGRFLGSGEMPIERAIAEYRFVYGRNAASARMEQPPGTPSLDIASAGIAALFERAFGPRFKPQDRPTALDWVAGLAALEQKLTQCPFSPSHVHLSDLRACPWCEMEARSRVPLFTAGQARHAPDFLNLDETWKQVASIPHPGPTPQVEDPGLAQSLRPSRRVRTLKLRRAARPALVLVLVAAIPALVGVYLLPAAGLAIAAAGAVASIPTWRRLSGKAEMEAIVAARGPAEARWREVAPRWSEGAGCERFEAKRREIDELGQALQALPAERLRRLNELMARRPQMQQEAFLDRFAIPAKGLSGIGAVRKATLQSYGIETAGDIETERLLAVPGIGTARSTTLVRWRRSIEEEFVFDPSQGIDPAGQACVEHDIRARHRALVAELQQALSDLRKIHDEIAWTRGMQNLFESEYRQYAQAVTDARALDRRHSARRGGTSPDRS